MIVETYQKRDIKAISLFSGAGGLDVGFEQAGYCIVFANEFDHDAAAAWRLNRPSIPHNMVEGDINDHMNELREYDDIDVIIGGPPCQGFSVAGKMDPKDQRSQLVWSFLDAIAIVRPKVFVMENVAALGLLRKWEPVRKGILSRGRNLGYDVSFKVHHTPDYGVPENRDRVIFIGVRKDIGSTEVFYERLKEHLKTHANDFMDFAEHLGTNDSETVMHDELWFTVQMWSEFHARRNGFLRVLNAATNNTLQFPEDYMANEIALIRSMWNERREENELYELMQLCGRYSILEELFPDETNGFNEDMLKGVYSGMKLFVCNRIYKFCTEHKTFDVFIKDAEKLRSLIS